MSVAVLASIPMGSYINGFAVLAFVVVLLIWAKLLTWIDKDAPLCRMPRLFINSVLFGGLSGSGPLNDTWSSQAGTPFAQPAGVDWDRVQPDQYDGIPFLRALRARLAR